MSSNNSTTGISQTGGTTAKMSFWGGQNLMMAQNTSGTQSQVYPGGGTASGTFSQQVNNAYGAVNGIVTQTAQNMLNTSTMQKYSNGSPDPAGPTTTVTASINPGTVGPFGFLPGGTTTTSSQNNPLNTTPA
jgi:hypothetical protein